MGDDHSQRAFRSTESIARTGQPRAATASAAAPANDPLAELARLIGQNDPFGEAAQAASRLAAAGSTQQPHASPQSFASEEFSLPPAQQHYAGEPAGAAQYAAPPTGFYANEQGVPGYLMARGAGEHVAYADEPPFAGDQDVYDDDVPPPRRRIGLVFGLFALAVAGSAAAFGYHAMFGPAGTQGPPPVIKADTTPSKIVPEKPKDTAKLINERVGDGGAGERIVAREEKPVDIADKIAPAGFPPAPMVQPVPPQASAGNGVIATAPRKVHTITIRPDGEEVMNPAAAAPSAPPPVPAAPPVRAVSTQSAQPAPSRPAAPPLAPARPAAREPAAHVARAAAPEAHPAPARNAPLSLSPDAPRAPTRVANVAPASLAAGPAGAAPAAKKGGYAVQVSSQRSEQEAEAAFRALQGKYPKQLGGQSMFVHKVELGAKGTYYRALVGPFASSADASALCASLKSAGGNCFIQRN